MGYLVFLAFVATFITVNEAVKVTFVTEHWRALNL
jgi:hypothetical protein